MREKLYYPINSTDLVDYNTNIEHRFLKYKMAFYESYQNVPKWFLKTDY
jgi:hypothetical protein